VRAEISWISKLSMFLVICIEQWSMPRVCLQPETSEVSLEEYENYLSLQLPLPSLYYVCD
jgi:hypothetical protein